MVETLPVGLFPAGSIVRVSGDRVITKGDLDRAGKSGRSRNAEQMMTEIERTKRGIEKYLKIMDMIGKTNVSENEEFQHLFNGFYQVRRNKAWRKVFYSLMEERKNTKPNIEEIMRFLEENTEKGSVELSFASKLLHTIDPTCPIYDKKVATFLNLPASALYWHSDKKIAHQVANYNAIVAWYQTPSAQSFAETFDTLFPEYARKVGKVKKIDFIIWRGLSEE